MSFIYAKPTCKKGSKLIKSRCECKSQKKAQKKPKNKTVKKAIKKDSYDEEWAKTHGNYVNKKPTATQLKTRRKWIDEIYKLYKDMKELDKTALHPKEWGTPPEYCYKEQLKDQLKGYKNDLKMIKKMEAEKKKKEKKQTKKIKIKVKQKRKAKYQNRKIDALSNDLLKNYRKII